MTFFIGDGSETGGRRGSGLTLLVLDRVAIAALNLPGGETWSWARGLGREVSEEAKVILIADGGVNTGQLLHSVDFSTIPVGLGVQVNVRATAHHALWYIKGTRPHPEVVTRMITYASGKRAGQTDRGYMKFFHFKSGRIRYEQEVFHPGWRGNNFLDEAKRAVLIRRGII